MAETETYLREEFNNKYVGFGWFGFLNNVFEHGLKDGSGSFFCWFLRGKISSKCLIYLFI